MNAAAARRLAISQGMVLVGWGRLGLWLLRGKNLYETLLRNMAFSTEQDALQEKQLPCWEREHARTEQSVEIVMPKKSGRTFDPAIQTHFADTLRRNARCSRV